MKLSLYFFNEAEEGGDPLNVVTINLTNFKPNN
jgi:hypothetical protein